jgi:hypothetical protein
VIQEGSKCLRSNRISDDLQGCILRNYTHSLFGLQSAINVPRFERVLKLFQIYLLTITLDTF